jgi:hypothetical protein
MSSELKTRLRTAAAIPPRMVSGAAIEAEVSRRQRNKRRVAATGALLLVAVFAASLPFILSHSPEEPARLATSPPPTTSQPSAKPTIQLSLLGAQRDGVTATVTGVGFRPDVSVQVVPCIPSSDCRAYQPIGTFNTDSAGDFTARLTLHVVVDDLYGGQEMCVQKCSLIARPRSGPEGAQSAPFDLVSLPPASEQCQPSMRTLQLTYTGSDASLPDSQSATISVRNAGSSPCWLYGAPGVTATKGNGSEAAVDRVVIDQSAASWPPKVITLPAGAAAQFTVSKSRCSGPSVALGTLNFGLFGGNYSSSVTLPSSGAESDVSLCKGGSSADQAPDNIMTVTAFTAG